MRKAIIGLAVGALALAGIGMASAAQAGSQCSDYAAGYSYQPDGYDVVFTVPVPETMEGRSRTSYPGS